MTDEQISTTSSEPGPGRGRGITAATLGISAAILVDGALFGALARPVMGPWLPIVASAVIFSGSVQFAAVALLLDGASGGAVFLSAATLNARNIVLGAVIRPKIPGGALRRLGLSWFLTDEAFGLAVTSGHRAAPTLLGTGAAFFVSWVAGTAIGVVLGAQEAVQEAATAVFPVLFIGLAAVTAQGLSGVLRATIAAGLTLGVAVVAPGARGFAPVAAAVAVSLVGWREG